MVDRIQQSALAPSDGEKTALDRLTDDQWAQRFAAGGMPPADVPWLAPVPAH